MLAVPVRGPRSGPPPTTGAVQTRWLVAGPNSAAEPALAPPTIAEPAPSSATKSEPASGARLVGTVAAPLAPKPVLALPGTDADADYLPRSLLSQPPAPLAPVLIDYPPIDDDKGRYVSELSLFIDATGNVAKVRVDGPQLPPALEAAARSAFLGARFAPGQLDGQAVRSRIRIEVVFESAAPVLETPAR